MMKIRVNINLDCVDEVVSKDDEYDQEFFFFFLTYVSCIITFEFS